MNNLAIKIENVSKQYRLGAVGTGTLAHDLNRFWHKVRGKEDPYLKIGDANDRTIKGGSEYVWALQGIDFEIEKGSVVGIIGRNGAGKSTLLKILSKVTKPTTGTIKLNGRIASLLEVGTGFNPELTGRDNIFLNGTIMGMRKWEIQKKLDEIVDFAGVERYLDTPVKRYSSGMYVRLAFGVAAHLEPEILIVDEVLAVGDAEFQKKALGKMKEVSSGQGRTVLFVSHNMSAIENLCDKSILLKNGQLLMEGKTTDVMNEYLKEATNIGIKKITEVTNRTGLGEVKFTDIKFLDESQSEIKSLQSGKKTIIRLLYKSEVRDEFSRCRISLAIKKDISPLVVLSSELTIKTNISLQKAGYIDFVVHNLPFSKGLYDLTLFLESDGSVQDWLTLSQSLEVSDGDFYGTGVNYPNGWEGKTVLINHSITIN